MSPPVLPILTHSGTPVASYLPTHDRQQRNSLLIFVHAALSFLRHGSREGDDANEAEEALEAARRRKADNEAEPVYDLVPRLRMRMEAADAQLLSVGRDHEALAAYLGLLLDLLPWHACPIAMTPDQAEYTGVAQL